MTRRKLLSWLTYRRSKDSSQTLNELVSAPIDRGGISFMGEESRWTESSYSSEFKNGMYSNGQDVFQCSNNSKGMADRDDFDDDDQVVIMPGCTDAEVSVDSFDIVASPLFDNDDVGYDSDSTDSPEELFQDEYYEEERVVGVVTTDETVSNDGKVMRPRRKLASFIVHRIKRPQLNKDDYMSRRTMTSFQERLNGLSMLPGAFYCLYYTFSGVWLFDNVDQVHPSALENIEGANVSCRITSWALQDLYVMPPLPILFIALGVVSHAPFSFIYHWHYCTTLPPGKPRFDHWSRKLDQAFIHVASAFVSYGTSGSWDFFVANAAFNAHCVWRNLVSKTATPLKTQTRILISIFAYTIPFLHRGDIDTFLLIWLILSAAFWLFSSYPIRGWSHTAFHVVVALVLPVLMDAAGELTASHVQITKAAQCAILDGKL